MRWGSQASLQHYTKDPAVQRDLWCIFVAFLCIRAHLWGWAYRALTKPDPFHPQDGMTWMLESISQVFWESSFWGHQIWQTRLRWLRPLFQIKIERKQHTVLVFQPGNIWQLSLSSLLFLLHPCTQAYKYTMESVAIPTQTQTSMHALALSVSFRSEIIPSLLGPVKLLQSLGAYSR